MSEVGPEYLNGDNKRMMDVLGALSLGTAISPLAVGATITTWVGDRSTNPFVRLTRVGAQGIPLEIFKLRTLPKGADRALPGFGTYDPRAGKIATFLRVFGLDETPQLANVIAGSMSLIGVRLSSEKSFAQLQTAAPHLFEEWYETAYCVGKPALVSPAQIYKRSFREWPSPVLEEGMRMDTNYANQASLAGDMRILRNLPIDLVMANLKAGLSSGERVPDLPTEPWALEASRT
jgi:lipopolysaccharide/colanic/teichoic acid biosynthesis glycosyltransferase